MRANPSASVFVVELDAMIARVQAALERFRVAEADPVLTARRANRIELNRRKLDQALTRLGR
jgi:2-methylisocitrate lyase-like PEP mutase family enzyme